MMRKILGPPGTGKTTRLLRYAQTFLKLGTPIDKIGYFAFTKKAAGEAKERMLDQNPHINEKELKHFRTLHSLAFWKLGMKKSQVMQDEHYEDIGRNLGIEVTVYNTGEETTGFVDSDSEYFNIINAARIKEISTEAEYNTDMYSQDLDRNLLHILKAELDNYKKAYSLKDYTDMIENFIVSEMCPQYDVVFIDEAQDLSPIQWKMFDILKKNSKHVILAGDDDQAIYGWAGADVDRFIAQTGKFLKLTESHRVPRVVHDIAMGIVKRISKRHYKEWSPKNKTGLLSYYHEFQDVDMSSGEWYVIARTRYMLNELENVLYSKGLYY